MRLVQFLLVLCFLLPQPARAEEVLQDISWRDRARELPRRALLADQGILHVENSTGAPLTVKVLVLDAPSITKSRYALTGRIRHTEVEGRAHLEMWSTFPDGSRHFTRTLSERGPMRHLEGTSGWRDITLPFRSDSSEHPTKLELNVVFVGEGSVDLSPLTLSQFDDDEDPVTASSNASGQWWGGAAGGLIGGGFGTLIGLIGALIGVLTSLGKARRLVIGLLSSTVVIGLLSLLTGFAAVISAQPYAVYFPLCMVGLVSTIVPAAIRPTIMKRFEALELRKMRAKDAM